MISVDRAGNRTQIYDGQGRFVDFLLETAPGRLLLRLLVRPWVSRLAGWLLDRAPSRLLIGPFMRRNGIVPDDWAEKSWPSYNAFFCRRIRPEKRPFDFDPYHLVAPCDGKLTVCPIGPDSVFSIKGVDYTMESLTRSAELAERFCGGTLLLFRLSVDDYHRYSWACDGLAGDTVRIPGVFHTVNPRAAAKRPIYRENTREYTLLDAEVFGPMLVMEVGAMLVGRIVNSPAFGPVHRGDEKGRFEFGGSSIVVCLTADSAVIDEDIVCNSLDGLETLVKMGEKIGAHR